MIMNSLHSVKAPPHTRATAKLTLDFDLCEDALVEIVLHLNSSHRQWRDLGNIVGTMSIYMYESSCRQLWSDLRKRSIFVTAIVLNVPQIRQSSSTPYIEMSQFKTFVTTQSFMQTAIIR